MKSLILSISIVCSLPFFIIGFYEAYQSNREISGFIHTTGTVVGNHYITAFHEGTTSGAYLPEVEFYTDFGQKLRFTDRIGSLPPDYEPGANVRVIYNPKAPQDARINSWKRIWFVPVLLSGIGLLPIIIGVFLSRLIK